jgi:hypothetical protein
MSHFDYLFVIYTCKKNLEKANDMYSRYAPLMATKVFNIKTIIVYGDDSMKKKYEYKEDKYLIINVDDGYNFLYLKTLKLFKIVLNLFPTVKGCIKCDDDIILHLECIYLFIENLKKFNIYYSGFSLITYQNNDNTQHLINKNMQVDKKIVTPDAIYCGGPCYYLSKKSIEIVGKVNSKDYENIFYEDLIVGYILNKNNIYPVNSNLYTDNIQLYNKKISYHNSTHKHTLFVRIHGGLGNQMFQIASGYGIAKKNNMNMFILNSSNVMKQDFTHTTDNNFFIKSIFNNYTKIDLENIVLDNLKGYKEETCDCYTYCDLTIHQDLLLNGYFQNEKYFIDHKYDIIKKFTETPYYNSVMKYVSDNKEIGELLLNSYFIHVRRGDYLLHSSLYGIDYDSYYTKAIAYILERDKDAHFYITSDDNAFCKNYSVFQNIKKTFMVLEPLESMYFMSLCYKGAICCNSTFSWWGSYLNKNPNKIVLFPSKWINREWTNDIYYKGSIIIDI